MRTAPRAAPGPRRAWLPCWHSVQVMGSGADSGVKYGSDHGTVPAMTTTIDASGRLVVPKEIRRQAGIRPNSRLEVRFRDGRIEIEPAPVPVQLERKGRLVVAVAPKGMEALSGELVERTRRDLRRSRSS